MFWQLSHTAPTEKAVREENSCPLAGVSCYSILMAMGISPLFCPDNAKQGPRAFFQFGDLGDF